MEQSSVETKEKSVPVKPSTGVAAFSLKDQVAKALHGEPHRAFTAEDLVRVFKLQSPKDPQKQAKVAEEIATHLRNLADSGQVSEVAPALFKARLFFDKEQQIEHAFIGGMGNTHYRFSSPVFRVNLGVLSLYFVRDPKQGNWLITIKDTTIGKDYCLVQRLRDGVYIFGSQPREAGQENYWQIEGKYIAKKQMTLTLAGEDVTIEDHHSLNGTRIDSLTKEGRERYQEAARLFLKNTDPRGHKDIVRRGRFALEQLLNHHRNFETTFFSAVVDAILLADSAHS